MIRGLDRVSDLTSRVGQLAPYGTYPVLFQISKCVLKSSLKNTEYVPFGANLPHLGPKLEIPGLEVVFQGDSQLNSMQLNGANSLFYYLIAA